MTNPVLPSYHPPTVVGGELTTGLTLHFVDTSMTPARMTAVRHPAVYISYREGSGKSDFFYDIDKIPFLPVDMYDSTE
jgi:hypothetical protein